jgi:hypothetical protein
MPVAMLRKLLVERVPTISVDANGSASINISLERAAAVNGTILYDDGSPAPGGACQGVQTGSIPDSSDR